MGGRKGDGRLISGEKMQTEYRTHFFCALILYNTFAALKSLSCIPSGSALLTLRHHLFAAGSRSHHMDS